MKPTMYYPSLLLGFPSTCVDYFSLCDFFPCARVSPFRTRRKQKQRRRDREEGGEKEAEGQREAAEKRLQKHPLKSLTFIDYDDGNQPSQEAQAVK